MNRCTDCKKPILKKSKTGICEKCSKKLKHREEKIFANRIFSEFGKILDPKKLKRLENK